MKALLDDPALTTDAALEKLIAESRAPMIQKLLSRAALTRSFDQEIYEKVLVNDLLPNEEVPSFDEFVRLPEISRVPGASGSHWLSAGEREYHLRAWQDQILQSESRRLQEKIVDLEEVRHPNDPMARLPYLVSVDQERALGLFEAAFQEADDRFDLPQCFALLGALDAQGGDLGPSLQEARRKAKRRYKSRALFAESYYRTGTFYRREKTYQEFRSVLDLEERWIFHLHATGGMGKTMFLRWLVARDLVPSGIMCARVDFDQLKIDAVRTYPWLVLAPLIRQLDEQTPEQNLASTASLIEPFAHLLQPENTHRIDKEPLPHSTVGEELVVHIGHALQSLGGRRIVLVLDTLEVVMPFHDTFIQIFNHLKQLNVMVPALRIVLAGRYNITAKIPSLEGVLADQGLVVALPRFSGREAKGYLQSRGIQDRVLRNTIVEKVKEPVKKGIRPGCNPFKLALLADLTLASEKISKEDIRALPSADYQYLLERVIKRIPEQPLRWVVRYGVVPRRLTIEYIESVMLCELRCALSGEKSDDTSRPTGRRPKYIKHIEEQDLWQPDPVEITADQLWDQLMRYESGRGWLSHSGADATYRGVIQFHSDVVDPMRDLLSYQIIFQRLQCVSADYFLRLANEAAAVAEAESVGRRKLELIERWTDMMCEVIFHRFQSDETRLEFTEGEPRVGAAAFWREVLEDPRLATVPWLRLKLAREPLGREYCEDEEVPRSRHGRPLVDTDTLVVAHLSAAQCIVDLMRYTGKTASRTELRHHVQLARKLAGESLGQEAAEMLGLLEANLMLMDGHPEDALAWLDEELSGAGGASRRINIAYLAARVCAAVGQPKAVKHFQELVMLMRIHEPSFPTSSLLREAGDYALALGHLGLGRKWLRQALHAAQYQGDTDDTLALALQLGQLEIELGDFQSAHDLLGIIMGMRAHGEIRVELYCMRLHHVLLRSSEQTYRALLDLIRQARDDRDLIDALMLAAEVAADLLRYSDASRHWVEATRLIEREGGSKLLGEIAVHQARARNRMGAHGEVITIARSSASVLSSDLALSSRMMMEYSIALVRGLDFGLARSVLEPLLDAVPADIGESSELQVICAGQALSLGLALGVFPISEEYLERLYGYLSVMRFPSRIKTLSWMEYCRVPIDVPCDWTERIFALLNNADENGELEPYSFVHQSSSDVGADIAFIRGLRYVEAYRAFCAHERADVQLRQMAGNQNAIRNLLLLEAHGRLVVDGVDSTFELETCDESSGLFQGVILLHMSHQALLTDQMFLAKDLYERANRLLQTEELTTQWDAKLLELAGLIAAVSGQFKEARHMLATAAGMYQSLGDLQGHDRLSTTYSEETPQSELSRLTVIPIGAGGRDTDADSGVLLESLAPRPGAVISNHFAEWFTNNWLEVRRMLGELLFTRGDQLLFQQVPVPDTLGLAIPPTFLAALPWELAVFPGEMPLGIGAGTGFIRLWSRVRDMRMSPADDTVRFLQERLIQNGYGEGRVDGILGPVTTSLVRNFQQKHGLETSGVIDEKLVKAVAHSTPVDHSRPRILIVQSSLDVDSREHTSYGARGGRDLAAYYLSRANVEVVTSTYSKDVLEAVEQLKPAMIHLVGTVRETSGMIFVDLARRRANSEGTSINATLLDTTVKRLYAGRPRPFLVFDAIRPPSMFDAALALGWRNTLAADLFHLGGFSGVLATGLEQGQQLGNIAEIILEGIENGEAIGTLANNIRKCFTRVIEGQSDDELARDAALAYLCTALFTEDPRLPCLLF